MYTNGSFPTQKVTDVESYYAEEVKRIVDKVAEHYGLTLNKDIVVKAVERQYSKSTILYDVDMFFEEKAELFVHRLVETDEDYDVEFPNLDLKMENKVAALTCFLESTTTNVFDGITLLDCDNESISFRVEIGFMSEFTISKTAKVTNN